MPTNLKKYEKKAKTIELKLAKIQVEYPDFNFRDGALIRAIDKHRELTKELIYANVNATGCREKNFKCENCICELNKKK
jgi:hypothetical protein